jgi:hypothetical protein
MECRNRSLVSYLPYKMNYHYYCTIPGLEFMYLPESVEGLPYQGQGDGRALKIVYFWAIILEMMTDVVISKVDAYMYGALRKEDQHVASGELVGPCKCIILQTRCHTN